VQYALPGLLEMRRDIQAHISTRTRANLHYLDWSIAADSPFRLRRPEGGWYAVIEAPRVRTEEEWALRLLNEHGVLTQPGYFFDFEREAFLVVSLLTARDVFRQGADRLLHAANL